MAGPVGRVAAIAVAAALAVGFGGGFLAAKVLPAGHTAPGAQASDAGFAWPFFGKPRDPRAPRAGVRKPEGFAVWTSRLDTSRAEPSACIRMTRQLDPRRSYGDFVTVEPDLGHPAAVTARNDELCVAGVGFEGRKVTLLHGLQAASGEVLGADAVVEFSQGEKPAFVGFSGDGVILPREDADGVGLETVNVTRLKVEVWRVPDRNLVRKSISAPTPTEEGGYASDYGADSVGEDGRQVWTGTMDVHGQADQRATTVFPLGSVLKTLQPGAYVVKAVDASGLKGKKPDGAPEGPTPAQARRWILFTDMALQAYDGADALDVTVRSLKTAKAMAGVRVALVGKDGNDLASAQSDTAGRVHFARALLAGEAGAKPARIMAYGPRADFTTLDLERAPVDLSKQDIGGRDAPGGTPQTGKSALDAAAVVDGFLYADRGVYRPGETVHLVGLLRDHLAHAVKDRHGALVVKRPSGLEFRRVRFEQAPNGAVAQDLVLPAGAPRGQWTAAIQMDGADATSGAVSFQVEDFVPQRLAVTIAADQARPVIGNEVRKVQVEARFLYGATAAGLPVQAEARVREDADPFPALKGYAWGDAQNPFAEKLLPSPASTTDGQGHAIETLDTTELIGAGAPLTATFSASVFEPGGRPVSEQATLKVRTKPLYLGVKTSSSGTGDTPTQSFDVVAVDPNGRRIAAPAVSYTLIAENWNYDWFEQNGRWSWRRTSRDTPIAKGVLNVGAAAPARFNKRLAWGDYRLVLEDPATGARTVIRQASGWGEATEGVEAPDTARVSAVKEGYRTGDTVEVHIQAPFAGEAQVAVASDRLLSLKSLSVPKEGATVRLKADASWGGGAYVLVSVVQPRDPVSSPKPRRALGLVYVPLDVKGRKLTVAFQTPAKIDSKSPLNVPLTVKGLGFGQRAHVTVAAVDEGILRLTHQKNPDPVAWYFGKRALGLAYRDDYGRLLDPNLGAAGAVNFGGDEVGGAGLNATPIKTVALWSGVVDTDAGGHATVHLPASPEFDGQLRLVAVAWTDDAVGSGASDEIVRRPVVTELTLPRFLAPGDRMLATLELHNVEARVGDFMAQVFGEGGVQAPFRKLWSLVVGQRVVEHLMVAAPDRPGIGRVSLRVNGPGFATAKSWPIQTRIGWGSLTRATTELQRRGEAFTPTPPLLAGLSPGELSMTVSYSPFRGFDPAPIADSLSHYPYGCSEQLVSTAYPLLYAPQLGRDLKLHAIDAALVGAVSKLLDREALDGSFGLWRVGDGEADGWLGAYIVDFLLEAKAHGAPVPEDALARALNAMRLISRPEGFSSVGYRMDVAPFGYTDAKAREAATTRLKNRAAAYALYDMAKAGRGDLPRLRWFHDVAFKDTPDPLARAQIGAGLAAMGDRGRAHDSFTQAAQALGYKAPEDWYQSPLRDTAAVIALAYEAGETGIARSLQGRLEQSVKAPDALNTQEQARLLQAAHAMLAASGPPRIEATGVRLLGGSRWAVGKLADARFVNRGGPIWRTVTVHGLPASAPGAESAGMRIEKRLFGMNGSPIDPAALKQGERVIVRLSGGTSDARPVMTVVDDALPAGLEIESTLSPADAQGETSSGSDEEGGDASESSREKPKAGPFAFLGVLTEPSTQEKRDDRYVAAMTLSGGKGFVLAYIARAVTPGDMFLPGASAKDMYRPAVHGQSAAGRMKIAPAP